MAIAQNADRSLAERLMALDPGARIAGNTQVLTEPGAEAIGVPGRINFILGLDAGQRIVGGNGDDQLGVRGERGRINGGPGADLIHGGAEGDLIKGARAPT